MAESFGVEGRGGFYDGVGAMRDVVQNHLLQVLAILAMEPPVSPEADALRDEKVKVFRAMRPLDAGTRSFEVSTRATWMRKLSRRDRRWRPSSRAASRSTRGAGRESPSSCEPARAWHTTPSRPWSRCMHRRACSSPARTMANPHPNTIQFRLGESDGVTMTVQAKQPGPALIAQPVELSVDFGTSLGNRRQPYERLLGDAIAGDSRRFAREDGVETHLAPRSARTRRPGAGLRLPAGQLGSAGGRCPAGRGTLARPRVEPLARRT